MGFRSTFTTDDFVIVWPDWFREKYAGSVHVPDGPYGGPLAAKGEGKTYGVWANFPADVQRAIDWDAFRLAFRIVFLHECGGISRCEITRDAIQWTEPDGWRRTNGVEHSYCYGCSDAARAIT